MSILFRELPPIADGLSLEDEIGWISVIKPVARQNIAKNPSVETGTTGWTANDSATMLRVATRAYYGAWSLDVTPSGGAQSGVYYDDTTAFVNGTTYAVSIAIRGSAGRRYELSVRTTAGATLAAIEFIATGFWERVWLPYTEASGANRRVYVRHVLNGLPGLIQTRFFVDGLQIEPCGSEGVFPTTYLDGEQLGLVPNESPPAYGWTGTPHASTSYRSAQTRAGGRVISWKDYGFTLSALIGLGMPVPEHHFLNFSVLDGSQYRDTRDPNRSFSLVGRFDGADLPDLMRNRGQLGRLLARDLLARRQPLLLQLQPSRCGTPIAELATLQALYRGGLDGNHTNDFAENAGVQFESPVPFLVGGNSGASLDPFEQLVIDLWARTPTTGAWGWLGGSRALPNTTADAVTVLALALTPDGYVYIGGTGTTMGGVTNANNIVRFRDGAYSLVQGAANGTVRGFAINTRGRLVLVGDFTTLNGGGTAANRVAIWDGSAYSALGTGLNGAGYCAVVDRAGNLYVGGDFTLAGGVANTVRIAKWDGSTWTPLSTGCNAVVRALAIGADGTTLYAGGDFTTAGGVTVNGVARWDGTTWHSMGGGVAGGGADVYALAVLPDGTLIAGGTFTSIGGITAASVGSWNGVQWSAMSGGLGATVQTLAVDPQTDTIYAGGTFTNVDGLTGSGYARWNGSVWVRGDILLNGQVVNALLIKPDSTIILGMTIPTSPPTISDTPGLVTATNNGTAETYAIITITGDTTTDVPTEIQSLYNITTGAMIDFNLTITRNERIVIILQPDRISVVSNTRGLIQGAFLAGSQSANFAVQPGPNIFSFLMSTAAASHAIYWTERFLAFDDLVPVLP